MIMCLILARIDIMKNLIPRQKLSYRNSSLSATGAEYIGSLLNTK